MHKHLSELLLLVITNLKVRYRETFIGFLWVILNPIVLYVVQVTLFIHILKQTDSSYYAYLLTGLLPWYFLSQTAEMGCNYIGLHSNLIKNLKIHPLKLIIGLALENFINLICASAFIFTFILIQFGGTFGNVIHYLLCSLWLLGIVIFITFIASFMNLLFKDVKYILHFLFTILYFMTPTFFYVDRLPLSLQNLIQYNPFFWIISLFRTGPEDEMLFSVFLINFSIMIVLMTVAGALWVKLRNKIYLKL